MKVMILKTEKAVTVSDSYGARLIEQGKAIPCPSTSARKKTKAKPGEA